MKNIDDYHVSKSGHIYRFINDLIAKNGSKGSENSFNEIYLEESELKKENKNDNVTIFMDLSITINEGKFSTKLYSERDRFIFFHGEVPCKYINIPSKNFLLNCFCRNFEEL